MKQNLALRERNQVGIVQPTEIGSGGERALHHFIQATILLRVLYKTKQ